MATVRIFAPFFIIRTAFVNNNRVENHRRQNHMKHHNLPEATPDSLQAPAGNEIRFPAMSGGHNIRARKEDKA